MQRGFFLSQPRSASNAAQLASDNTRNSAVQPVVQCRRPGPTMVINIINTATTSSAAQPASDSIAALVASVIPCESLLLIVGYVGAHNLETDWTCSECNPYWYNWYCHECRLVNKYLYWSPRRHFGYCGQCCGCCRNANGEHGWCDACDDLWNLKVTCHRMQDLLKTYSGT